LVTICNQNGTLILWHWVSASKPGLFYLLVSKRNLQLAPLTSEWRIACKNTDTRRLAGCKDAGGAMDPNRFLTLLPEVEMIAVGDDSLIAAQSKVVACEACDPTAVRPFFVVLDEVTHRRGCVSDYILSQPAKCCRCGSEIFETTFVAFEPEPHRFDLSAEAADLVLINEDLLREAEEWIGACERCSEHAEYSFDQILDSLTGCDPRKTDYLMQRGAKCPRCCGEITEKTLVSPT
jgi:hypothetical protein